MKYMGSKRRIAKHIIPIMTDEADKSGITTWIEPFVGGGNLIDKVPDRFNRKGYDLNPHVIQAMIDIRDSPGDLPDCISEDEYKSCIGRQPEKITSWIRFVCSFGGKFDCGFARNEKRNYCRESKDNALNQSKFIHGISFECLSYDLISVKDALIYCDPPYKGTTGYKVDTLIMKNFMIGVVKWQKKISFLLVNILRQMISLRCGEESRKLTLQVQESQQPITQ